MSAEPELIVPSKPLPAGRVTYEEFLDWLDDETHAEWVDGEIILMSPINLRHDAIVGFLRTLLAFALQVGPYGVVHGEPVQVRLPEWLRRGRSPDVTVVLSRHAARLRPTYVDGPPDLIVEVVSPDSRRRDLVEKLAEYEAAGVAEYWAIDEPRQDARFYVTGPDGKYELAQSGASGIFHSRVVPSMRINAAWLWQDPLPNYRDVLRELGLL